MDGHDAGVGLDNDDPYRAPMTPPPMNIVKPSSRSTSYGQPPAATRHPLADDGATRHVHHRAGRLGQLIAAATGMPVTGTVVVRLLDTSSQDEGEHESKGIMTTSWSRNRSIGAISALIGAGVVTAALSSGGKDAAATSQAGQAKSTYITVTVSDVVRDPAGQTARLRKLGVDAHTGVAPATADVVGTFVKVETSRPLPPGTDLSAHDDFDEQAESVANARRLASVQVGRASVRIPRAYPHELVLIAGRAPRPGQSPVYDAGGSIRRTPSNPEPISNAVE